LILRKTGDVMESYSLPLYHQATLQLLDETPLISSASLDALHHLEQARQLILPAAVKAWYALEQAPALLSRYPPVGVVRSAQQLGDLENYWSDGVSHSIDLLQQGRLLMMTEEQNNCVWAIELNGEDDPPVVVSEELNPSATWHLCAETFLAFVYTCVWDSLVIKPEDQLFGCKEFVLPTELAFLHERFQEGLRTSAFPGVVDYRFFSGHQRILIQEAGRQASWYFAAETDAALKQLVEQVLQCETLMRDLHLERNGMTEWEFMFPDENEEE
jgi:hypothetical protein